jgi:cytochrome c-type biogenesis protein CcmH/NrfG
LNEAQRAEWHLDRPENRKRFDERRQMLYEYGRRALTDVWQDDPKNPEPLLRLAEFELGVGRPGAALRAAQQALDLSPAHKKALELEQQALQAVRARNDPQPAK